MFLACLDKKVFLRLVEEENLVIKNNRFIFTKSGRLITELNGNIHEDMFIPDQFYWLAKKAIETHFDLFNEIPTPLLCIAKRETSMMKRWELHGPVSEK
jgi:hypothetical protein